MRIDAEAKSSQGIEGGALALRPILTFNKQEVRVNVEPSPRDDPGVEGPECPGSSVAGIDCWSQSLALAFLIHALEGGQRHNGFASYFKSLRKGEVF